MKKNFLFSNLIRVNKAKNYNIAKINNFPRYSSNDNNVLFNNNYHQKSNLNNFNINKTLNPSEYAALTIDNYNKQKIKHYQSKDSLNDQLNLIKFKMRCDIIGQKLNQLKSFADGMKIKEEDKNQKQLSYNNNLNAVSYKSNIQSKNKIINNNHALSTFSLNKNKNLDNYLFNSFDNKKEIRPFNSRPLLNSKYIRNNKFFENNNNNKYFENKNNSSRYDENNNIRLNTNNNTYSNNDLKYIYHFDDYFTEEDNKNKKFNKTCNNNFNSIENKKYQQLSHNLFKINI